MDPEGPSGIFSVDPLMPHGFGVHLFSHFASFVNNTRYLCVPGSLALQEALHSVSKFAGALIIWLGSGSNFKIDHKVSRHPPASGSSNCKSSTQVKQAISCGHNFLGSFHNHQGRKKSGSSPFPYGKISLFSIKQLCKEAEPLPLYSVLSLAAALIPPFDKGSPDALAVTLDNGAIETQNFLSQRLCEVEHHGCGDLPFQCLDWNRHAVEPRTGIEFPTLLDNSVDGDNNFTFTSEVLVGTGSRTMKIIRIKSLKIYAFGFYVHPFDVCEKLGPKYASTPVGELNKSPDFYRDLLREDINMTVRLVVSCNGIKINTVRDAFEKSLRIRLTKTNPDADYTCLQAFSSIFSQDIPLHVGTTINFRRTADGCLVTEIEGNQLGVVQSKDLCRAFFGMYIGDIPVCEQTKEEIGRNVASLMRSC